MPTPAFNHARGDRIALDVFELRDARCNSIDSDPIDPPLIHWQACVEVMQERPRRRQLQTLPPRVTRLITYCQAKGLSNI